MLVPLGGVLMLILLLMRLPESGDKPPILQALKTLPRNIDPIGFIQFAGAVTMLLLAITWGGAQLPWSSPTIVGLLCGGAVLLVLFSLWVWCKKKDALITPSCLSQRAVYASALVVFLQGGGSQSVPFYLPLWLQAIKGDDASESAVHILPSLATMVVSLISFGALVRKLRYIPPWAIVGSAIASIGAGLFTTLKPGSPVSQWVGYQILGTIGRGISLQAVSHLPSSILSRFMANCIGSLLHVCKSLCLLPKTP